MAQCRWTRAIPSQIHFCAACPAEQLKHEERKRGRRQVLKVEGPQGSDVGKRQRAERRTELCRSVCTEVVAAWTVGRVIISSVEHLETGRTTTATGRAYFPRVFTIKLHSIESNGARVSQEKPCHNRSVDLLRNGGKKRTLSFFFFSPPHPRNSGCRL